VIRAKQEADLAEVILSPFEGEEYELTDPEGRRLFGLSVYERALLSEQELRRHEIEFLDWLRWPGFSNHFDTDPDHFGADRDSAFHSDADPSSTMSFISG
jgi:hypothetical protein